MQVILANPRGFCAGVERAIAIVERAIEKFGAPIYVRHEVVHNQFVCDDLRAKGAIFVDQLAEVPAGSIVIFSAHGVSKAVIEEAARRVASRSSTPPARWSPRCMSKSPGCAGRAARSS
jgi:4-hydroxy-3-methylbut-2-enyl diphosphate reductase